MNLREFAEGWVKAHSLLLDDHQQAFTAAGYFLVDPGNITEDQWYEMVRWIGNNVHPDNYIKMDGVFYFEFQEDAAMCILRWK